MLSKQSQGYNGNLPVLKYFRGYSDNKEHGNTKRVEVGFQLNVEDLVMQDQKKRVTN